MNKYYLGIDIGSVSLKIVLLNESLKLEKKIYMRTYGQPIQTLKKVFKQLTEYDGKIKICGVTGSGRKLIGAVVNADLIKNEITAHSTAVMHFFPKINTVFEIGGQDSKIIILKDHIPIDFAMNTVCAAGTGSFLDQQAARLNIPIEKFGDYALKSKSEVDIQGRCTVFAESDMVQKQQLGYSKEDVINGLCKAMARNYFLDIAQNKETQAPYMLIGGVAANKGIVKAFEEKLKEKILVPENYEVMGAIGIAILASKQTKKTKFKGFTISEKDLKKTIFRCKDCPNYCEILKIEARGEVTYLGSRCGKYS